MSDNSNVTTLTPTAASILAQAKAEVRLDFAKGAKAKLVTKYRQIADAKKVVANLEAEAAVLEKDIEQELAGA